MSLVKRKQPKSEVIPEVKDNSEISPSDVELQADDALELKESEAVPEDNNTEDDAEMKTEVICGDTLKHGGEELQAEFSEESDVANKDQEDVLPTQEEDSPTEEGKSQQSVISTVTEDVADAQQNNNSCDSNQINKQESSANKESDGSAQAQDKSCNDSDMTETEDDSLIKENQNEDEGDEKPMDIGEEDLSYHKEEALAPLKIPEGKDGIAELREHYPWQVRVYPFTSIDATRADFSQIWAMAKSSSVVWTTHIKSSGVGEFLLEDQSSLQKFMRKLMWHVFVNRQMTIEITERKASEDGTKKCPLYDHISSTAIFKYNNRKARQLIKDYSSPRGKVTERSVYVSNVGTDVSADIMKGIFPCALKIAVASDDTSSTVVETESEKAAFNYLVVYQQIQINGLNLELSTSKHDWEGARKIQHTLETRAVSKSSKSSRLSQSSRSDRKAIISISTKRPGSSRNIPPAKRGRLSKSSFSTRDRGISLRDSGVGRGFGLARGRGSGMARERGGRRRGLLPIPSEGWLPTPSPPTLMSLPGLSPPLMPPDSLLDAMMMAREQERQAADLREARSRLESEVLETRAKLMLTAHRAEVEAASQLQNRLSLLNHKRPAPNRSSSLDLMAENLREMRSAPRLLDDYEPEEWFGEPAAFHASHPSDKRGFDRRAFSRGRRQEEFKDQRSTLRPAPYLLEAPEDIDQSAPFYFEETFDYGTSPGRSSDSRYHTNRTQSSDLFNKRRALLERERTDMYEFEGPSASGRRIREEERRSRGAATNYEFNRHY